jgi:hypothetical protein
MVDQNEKVLHQEHHHFLLLAVQRYLFHQPVYSVSLLFPGLYFVLPGVIPAARRKVVCPFWKQGQDPTGPQDEEVEGFSSTARSNQPVIGLT